MLFPDLEKYVFAGGVGDAANTLPFSLLIMESIPLCWNAIKWSKLPYQDEEIIQTSSK